MVGASLELREVSRRQSDHAIIDRVTWEIPAGAIASIIGPSGSGKSSLLRLINRLDEPTSGHILVDGRDITGWHPRDLRTAVLWVPQQPSVSTATAREYLDVPVTLGIATRSAVDSQRSLALEIAQLDLSLLDREVDRLSGGERSRLALARTLQLGPRMLLVDEPTSSLDAETSRRLLDRLRAHALERNMTLLVVSHRLVDVRVLGGELMMLDKGKVRTAGPTSEILEREGDAVRRVLAGEMP